MIAKNKKVIWSIIEQFGGTGILFLLLPFVSRLAGSNILASYALTVTITAVATIYSGGVILRAKELNSNYVEDYSQLNELKKISGILCLLTMIVVVYVVMVCISGKLSVNDAVTLATICISCVFLELQNSTAIVYLKTKGDFKVTACAEMVSKFGTVVGVFLLYRYTDSMFAGAMPVLMGQLGRFVVLKSSKKITWVGESENKKNKHQLKGSTFWSVIAYGITSYAVANGEKVYASFATQNYMAIVYALTIIPTLIPALVNAIRVTTLGLLSSKIIKNDKKSKMHVLKIDIYISLLLSSIAFCLNPIYLDFYNIPKADAAIWQINLLCCTAAVLQSANIAAFYKIVLHDPKIVAKVVVLSGCAYALIVGTLSMQLGIFAVLIAKNIFFMLALSLVYFASKLKNEI